MFWDTAIFKMYTENIGYINKKCLIFFKNHVKMYVIHFETINKKGGIHVRCYFDIRDLLCSIDYIPIKDTIHCHHIDICIMAFIWRRTKGGITMFIMIIVSILLMPGVIALDRWSPGCKGEADHRLCPKREKIKKTTSGIVELGPFEVDFNGTDFDDLIG